MDRKKQFLPDGVMLIVFSFSDIHELMSQVSKLNRGLRKLLSKTELLNQERGLKIHMENVPGMGLNFDKMSYAIKLASFVEIKTLNFDG